ncbi:MAG: hypothetical protein GY913_11750 [Proteobacteria bacterium]|nr:hypothetical protein [Pseudomonadota bacterium]MCP4917588.1 hypothetical protein [Pseudomonadota bacterium]
MLLFAFSLLAVSQASTDPNLFNGPGFRTLAGLDTCSGDSQVVTATRLDARVELQVATTARFADSLRSACEPSTTVEARVIPNGPVFEVGLVGEDGAELDRVDLLSDADPGG